MDKMPLLSPDVMKLEHDESSTSSIWAPDNVCLLVQVIMIQGYVTIHQIWN